MSRLSLRGRSLGGAAPLIVFLATEPEALRPLPAEAFELAAWSKPKVGSDCHVSVGGVLYSVPWRLIGQRVDARVTDRRVEIFADGVLVKTHTRVGTGRQTDFADYPPQNRGVLHAHALLVPQTGRELGEHVALVVGALRDTNALHRLGSAQRDRRPGRRHNPARVDAACRRAIEVGTPATAPSKGSWPPAPKTAGPAATPPAHFHGQLVSALPQRRRRRVRPRPAHQHRPPRPHGRPQLPTQQTPRPPPQGPAPTPEDTID